MKIRRFTAKRFKRFTDLTIEDLPETTKLVVMLGPNGCGKSSVFDGFRQGHGNLCAPFRLWEENYHSKTLAPAEEGEEPVPPVNWPDAIKIEFHTPAPTDAEQQKKLFCFRSAYRNEPAFNVSSIGQQGKAIDQIRINRMIDNDLVVNQNYQRLVVGGLEGIFSGDKDNLRVGQLRSELIGKIVESLGRVFDDLILTGVGNPIKDGDFFFDKGKSKNFRYMNLSGGEKAAFDLLLDYVIKREEYNDTVFCIDEPDLHIHTRLQAKLLQEFYDLTPDNCQLWVSTHSIGMMRKARDLQREHPDQVVILDFLDFDFDQPIVLTPKQVTREFWKKTLQVALDDMANLVAPSSIYICEGSATGQGRPAFDATCLRNIFGDDYPDCEFVSGGNSFEVATDRSGLAAALGIIVTGAEIHRVIDRDDRTTAEVTALEAQGVKVLSRRHLESYLLDDDVLTEFCNQNGHDGKVADVLQIKQNALAASVVRRNPQDDLKSASGEIYDGIRRELQLTRAGQNADAFMRDVLAPLIRPGMAVYAELAQDLSLDAGAVAVAVAVAVAT